MANWQDPQGTTRTTGGVNAATVSVPRAARDVGLRSYMLSVYNYMASGVLLTGIVAMLFAPYAAQRADQPGGHRNERARLGRDAARRSASCSR